MSHRLSGHAARLALFAFSAGALIAGAASAQPYAQGGYAQGGYPPGPQANAIYVGGPWDTAAAQRRAWRRRQMEQQAAAPPTPQVAARSDDSARDNSDDVGAPPPPLTVATPSPAPAAIASAAAASVAPPAPLLTQAVIRQPAAPQSVALAHQIVESASAYLAYMRKASAIDASFTDGAGVARQVKTGAAYEARQFEEGAIAYAAIVALQEPAFVEGVRNAAGGDPDRIRQIAAGLMANPVSAITFTGADAAAARSSAALRLQGDHLMSAGVKVKQAAYDVQHADWSKGDILEPEARLAGAKTLSATRLTPEREETETLLKVVLTEQVAPAAPGEGASSPVVSRGLALAALAVLGQAGEGSAERLQPILAEEKGGECLKMAKLNLFQCLAVAGPHYEDIFCLGQHAMMDTAQCVVAASGVSRPIVPPAKALEAAPTQVAQVSPAPQDYWVPTGGATGADTARK